MSTLKLVSKTTILSAYTLGLAAIFTPDIASAQATYNQCSIQMLVGTRVFKFDRRIPNPQLPGTGPRGSEIARLTVAQDGSVTGTGFAVLEAAAFKTTHSGKITVDPATCAATWSDTRIETPVSGGAGNTVSVNYIGYGVRGGNGGAGGNGGVGGNGGAGGLFFGNGGNGGAGGSYGGGIQSTVGGAGGNGGAGGAGLAPNRVFGPASGNAGNGGDGGVEGDGGNGGSTGLLAVGTASNGAQEEVGTSGWGGNGGNGGVGYIH